MAGRNFLFVPGPTNVPDRVLRAMVVSMEDHRSPKFPALTNEMMPGLKKSVPYRTRYAIHFPVVRHWLLGSRSHQHPVAWRPRIGCSLWSVQPFVD